MPRTMIAGLLIVLALFTAARLHRVEAASAPVVEAGHTYIFLWSCMERVGCHGETVRVVEDVRADGWVDVLSCTEADDQLQCRKEDRWRANLNQVLSIQRYSAGARVAE